MQPSIDRGRRADRLAAQDPSLPQVFGRYLLVQRLSRGGMGEIFLAKHGLAGFEKLAVIKKVLPHLAADEQFISRFVDEAQVAIKLQHVNVAQVFEVGRVGDEYFLALEYVDGRDLRRTLALLGHRKQRLPVDLALFIARELANGLAYAHRRTTTDGASLNLVHCDISPPNVLVSFEGETKVIDFGIAKSAMRGTATDPKMGFGKFGYMAPEQLIRGGVVDYRTDLYAAGVVLFELLTGTRLYEAGPEPDYRALATKVARGEHPLPSEIDPIARALRRSGRDRAAPQGRGSLPVGGRAARRDPAVPGRGQPDDLDRSARRVHARAVRRRDDRAARAPRAGRQRAPRRLPGAAPHPDDLDGVVRGRGDPARHARQPGQMPEPRGGCPRAPQRRPRRRASQKPTSQPPRPPRPRRRQPGARHGRARR